MDADDIYDSDSDGDTTFTCIRCGEDFVENEGVNFSYKPNNGPVKKGLICVDCHSHCTKKKEKKSKSSTKERARTTEEARQPVAKERASTTEERSERLTARNIQMHNINTNEKRMQKGRDDDEKSNVSFVSARSNVSSVSSVSSYGTAGSQRNTIHYFCANNKCKTPGGKLKFFRSVENWTTHMWKIHKKKIAQGDENECYETYINLPDVQERLKQEGKVKLNETINPTDFFEMDIDG
jgi:hypothetical protein